MPGIHKEYSKDRVTFFIPSLTAGEHLFEVRLEPRYAGSFYLNPAKCFMMYFPLVSGRSGIKTIHIEK